MKRTLFQISDFSGFRTLKTLFGTGALAAAVLTGSWSQGATWEGVDLTNGGAVSQNTKLTLSGGETVTSTGSITGSGTTLTVAGNGTFVIGYSTSGNYSNPFSGATVLAGRADGTSDSVTLKINGNFGYASSSSITMGAYSVLDFANTNPIGYASVTIVNTINLNGNATVKISPANTHANLGNVVVSGTGNRIEALNGQSSYCNYFLGGKITLNANSTLEFDAEKLQTRILINSLGVNEVNQSGLFEVGENAVLTIGTSLSGKTAILYVNDTAGGEVQLVKSGTGTMTVNGTILSYKSQSLISVQAGTLNATTITTDGRIEVSGGTLEAATVTKTGAVKVTGGTLNATSMTAANALTVSGGTLDVSSLTASGTTTLSSGTLKAADFLISNPAHEAIGTLNVTGGTLNVTNEMTVSNALNVSGGASGGHSINSLNVWNAGNATFSGGTTTVQKTLGMGSFIVDGGTLITTGADSSMGNLTVSSGTFNAKEKLTMTLNSAYVNATGKINVTNGSVNFSKELALPSTLTVSGGTVTANGLITGDGSLEISGSGKVVLKGSATPRTATGYSGSTIVKDGGILELAAQFARVSGEISLSAGTLNLTAGNGLGYSGVGGTIVETIRLANGSSIQNLLSGSHSNLGNVLVSGTGNTINGTLASSSYCNFFLGGQIVLAEDAELTMTMKKAMLRFQSASLIGANGEVLSGIFDVGTNANLVANIDSIRLQDTANGNTVRMIKRGTGTMTVNGVITDGGTVTVEAGTLNLNGTQAFTGNLTVNADGSLGTGNGNGKLGTLDLASTTTVIDGGRIQVDLSEAQSDLFVFGDLVLKDDARIELLWEGIGDESEAAETYASFLTADSVMDAAGNAITNLTQYLTGSLARKFQAVFENGAWSLHLSHDAIPEPSAWLLLLTGAGFLMMSRKGRKKVC